ncbi:MAG: thiamine diphosphokinase [Clostridia bacterium]|nr:thiamine diphosphokinase [Clostridia bacterium]MBQ8910948.1 thiamine diphosphokinase [Clostridia bacterium]
MKTCYIVGAGDNRATSFCPDEEDLVIAADGGLEILQKRGIPVDLILGDFDSLGYIPKEENLILHPVRKDETDLMLACREGLARGYRSFCLYGSLGGDRLSHTVANFQLLTWLADQGARGTLYGKGCEVSLLREESITFPGGDSGFLSLFAWGGEAEVSVKGLSYELQNALLTDHYPLGVSNEFCGRDGEITVHRGDVLLILEKNLLTNPDFCDITCVEQKNTRR